MKAFEFKAPLESLQTTTHEGVLSYYIHKNAHATGLSDFPVLASIYIHSLSFSIPTLLTHPPPHTHTPETRPH